MRIASEGLACWQTKLSQGLSRIRVNLTCRGGLSRLYMEWIEMYQV